MAFLEDLFLKIVGKKIKAKLDLQEGSMDGTKKWYQSTTIWSDVATGVIGVWAVITPLLATHGVNLPAIPGWLLTVLGAIGIHGRMTADKTIG